VIACGLNPTGMVDISYLGLVVTRGSTPYSHSPKAVGSSRHPMGSQLPLLAQIVGHQPSKFVIGYGEDSARPTAT
jgi:hypothetical protein